MVDEDNIPAFPLLLYLCVKDPSLLFKADLLSQSKVFFCSVELVEAGEYVHDFVFGQTEAIIFVFQGWQATKAHEQIGGGGRRLLADSVDVEFSEDLGDVGG